MVWAATGMLFIPAATAASGGSEVGADAWWYRAMGVADAHRVSTGSGVTIGLIDGPVDPDVPELRGQKFVPVANLCGGERTDTGENAGHATSAAVKIIGNGTGTGPDGIGVAGIAPEAIVRSYVASESPARGPECRSDDQERSAIARAIDAAVADHVRIISTSLGLPGTSDELIAAVQRALDAGVVVVAATGDKRVSTVVNPAAIRGTVAVAAVDEDYLPWAGNVAGDREAFVISAPGFRVPTGYFRAGRWSSMQLGTGTSEATPLVAGALALVAARYPNATGNQLIQNLIHNPAGDRPFGLDPDYGYGVVSVSKMLAADPTRWPDVNPLRDPAAPGAPGAPVPVAPVAPVPVAPAARDVAAPSESQDTAAHPVLPGPDASTDRLLELARIVVTVGTGALLLASFRRRDGARSHTRAPTRGD